MGWDTLYNNDLIVAYMKTFKMFIMLQCIQCFLKKCILYFTFYITFYILQFYITFPFCSIWKYSDGSRYCNRNGFLNVCVFSVSCQSVCYLPAAHLFLENLMFPPFERLVRFSFCNLFSLASRIYLLNSQYLLFSNSEKMTNKLSIHLSETQKKTVKISLVFEFLSIVVNNVYCFS